MEPQQGRMEELRRRLEALSRRQEAFSAEIRELRTALEALQAEEEAPVGATPPLPAAPAAEKPPVQPAPPRKLCRNRPRRILGGVCAGLGDYLQVSTALIRILFVLFTVFFFTGLLVYLLLWVIMPASSPSAASAPARTPPVPQAPPVARDDRREPMPMQTSAMERYVGENLIGKIGIVILVIGVSIGAKYSIDNNLIGPLARILLGYLVGVVLLGMGWRLRPRYENFSAVLVSGAMAILYFMTFSAYAFYAMFPQWLAFGLMVVFTAATVGIALGYNRQIIAHIGLVGAYCIPFLLSEGEDQPAVLLSYVGIINLGILYIAFRKYWKPLYLFAFAMTWLIFLSWYWAAFDPTRQTTLGWGFLGFFFAVFYAAFLAYKLVRKEAFTGWDVALLLSNGFIFYGVGYDLLESTPEGAGFLGLFTLGNALLHGLIALVIYKSKEADRSIFHLVAGLSLVFITIAIPVQLDGSWVTLLWMGEAVLLFWVGRVKQIPQYENLAYPLILLGFFSLTMDWASARAASGQPGSTEANTPFFNPVFLTALLSSGALGYLCYLAYKKPPVSRWSQEPLLRSAHMVGISALFLLVLYASFATEIANYWEQRYAGLLALEPPGWTPDIQAETYRDLQNFKGAWQLIYTLLFLSLLCLANSYRLRHRALGRASLVLNSAGWLFFMTAGLYLFSELRDTFLDGMAGQDTGALGVRLGLRYLGLLLLAWLMGLSYASLHKGFLETGSFPAITDSLLALTMGWVATSELLQWLALAEIPDAYKLWVSILWGAYALSLIGYGLWRQKRHLRIGAIGLLAGTLLKLFLYDLAHLNTLSKTIVFISLGVILLVSSYLYQRFRGTLSEEKPS